MDLAADISIIMPIYNAEAFLEEAINSVLEQSYQNFELLLCEDGSKDRSLDICRSFAERDSRISVYRHPGGKNRGVSASRNLGIHHAKGRFIALLDSDDRLTPESLSTRLRCFEQYPDAGVVFSPAFVIDEKGEPKQFCDSFTIGHFGPVGIPSSFDSLLIQSPGVITSSAMIRRSFLDGLRFAENLELQYEDWLFWIQLSTRCHFYQLPELLSYYRVHKQQAIGESLTKYYRCCLYCYRKLVSMGWDPARICTLRNNLFFGILHASLLRERHGLSLHQLSLYFLLHLSHREKWDFLKLIAHHLRHMIRVSRFKKRNISS
jgi:teichuronic acid biosynthesis glycosyltransferase TuaG